MLKIKIRNRIMKLLGKKHPEERYYGNYRSLAEPQYLPWKANAEFSSIFEKVAFDLKLGNSHQDGRYALYALVKQALLQEGDLIECGAHRGASAHFVGFLLNQCDPQKKREFFVLDSFEGFSDPHSLDVNPVTHKQFFFKGGHGNTSKEEVSRLLSFHERPIHVVQGWIPQSFQGLEEKRFCFAHIDVDLYQPTLDSLQFLYPRIVPGGVILLDDYGFWMCSGARKSIDDFLLDKAETLLPLPTGQAVLFKASR